MSQLRVAVDVGGTFTDVCIFDDEATSMRVTKVPSTPHDPMIAVMNGVERAGIDLHDVTLFSHGTTVATNALITRKFPAAALVTTRGFRDVIEIRDGTKDDLWDAYADVSGPYIRRRDRFEVGERIDHAGRVVEPLDEIEARRLAALIRKRGARTIAVCFLNSFANPAHETRMREILEEEIPDATVTTSAEILPEIFEYERFNTAVANAVLAPLVSGYVNRLADELREGGYAGDLLLLHSGGGSMTPRMVERYPVRLAASGIAAGAISAKFIANQCGYDNAVSLDMGGTSTDIALVADGQLRMTKEWEVEYGHPIIFPSIEVLTIGAGGTQPTNTDANVVLGRLGTNLAGGAKSLDASLAEDAIRRCIAEPLHLELAEAAESIVAVANANMADAVRLISIRRGYDPRDFALIAFGGAGALHGVDVARELNIPTVVVPPNPGVTSAFGCLLGDVQHDLSIMHTGLSDDADGEEIDAEFVKLESEAVTRLRHEGVSDEQTHLQRQVSMRYAGQWRSLIVPIGSGRDALAVAVEEFHREHEREYAYRDDSRPVEIYQLHLVATGRTPKPNVRPQELRANSTGTPVDRREVFFSGQWHDTPVYDRDALPAGTRFDGPAIINQLDSTTVVPPGTVAEIDEWLNIRIHLEGAPN